MTPEHKALVAELRNIGMFGKSKWKSEWADRAAAAIESLSAQGGAEAEPMIPRAENCGRYLAEVNDGRLLYLNHANTWQECPNFITAPAPAPVPDAGEADIETQAWNCDKWPDWLHAIVDKTNEVADRLDMSSEQAHAYAVLSALASNKPVGDEEWREIEQHVQPRIADGYTAVAISKPGFWKVKGPGPAAASGESIR